MPESSGQEPRRIAPRAAAGVAVLLALFGFWSLTGPAETASEPEPVGDPPRVERAPVPQAPRAASPYQAPAPADRPDEPGDDEAADRAALAEALEDDPKTQVVCDLDLPLPRGEGYLAIGGHSDFNGRRVTVVDGKAYLPLVYDLGDLGDATFSERSGLLSIDGYGPAQIQWSDPPADGRLGHCTVAVAPEPGYASLTGSITVDGGEPAAGAWVEGCGNMAFADGHGVVHMDIVTEPCTVIAMRQDGLLRTTSEPVEVTPERGRDVLVDIVIPSTPRGGLGVAVSAAEGGFLVEQLVEGGPAGEAGLAAGDVVVEVDGTPAERFDLAGFVDAVGGEAGTDVDLVLLRGGQRVEITVTRDVLSPG